MPGATAGIRLKMSEVYPNWLMSIQSGDVNNVRLNFSKALPTIVCVSTKAGRI
jgi:hypothetical protein